MYYHWSLDCYLHEKLIHFPNIEYCISIFLINEEEIKYHTEYKYTILFANNVNYLYFYVGQSHYLAFEVQLVWLSMLFVIYEKKTFWKFWYCNILVMSYGSNNKGIHVEDYPINI